MSEYSELLRNPFWQKRRNEILERDQYTCQCCNDQLTNLQVHHKYYISGKMPWEYPDEALITVCELCHEKEEFIKWLNKSIALSLQSIGFLRNDIIDVYRVIRSRVVENKHAESCRRYMIDVKKLLA